MTLVCPAPDLSLGVAQRLSAYLDCQARALGENGFQALAGSTLGATLLSAVVTLFIAIIGFRLVLGHIPDIRDGVGWALRLGFVLALVTSWSTFQTLVYRVAVDGPQEVASLLMSSAALSGDEGAFRVQVAYDQINLGQGIVADPDAGERAQVEAGTALVEPLPKTATVLVVSTVGLAGALKLGIGFLLALSPFAVVSLLFNGTVGLFSGWLRALTGLVLALVGATLVTAADLLIVEGELTRLRTLVLAGSTPADAQSLSTIVTLFALVATVAIIAGMWMASSLKLPPMASNPMLVEVRQSNRVHKRSEGTTNLYHRPEPSGVAAQGPTRAVAVARALSSSVHREQQAAVAAQGNPSPGGSVGRQESSHTASAAEGSRAASLGLAGRRGIGRRTRSATRRDLRA
ncbi:type IV secretion system protein [Sphingomonas sp. GCM10030256]|uniref:type IV secretion system protein n=1 Tax=Sphingomonas sp. GCM10030256 TaxID=3273427 RepID=UPI003614C482